MKLLQVASDREVFRILVTTVRIHLKVHQESSWGSVGAAEHVPVLPIYWHALEAHHRTAEWGYMGPPCCLIVFMLPMPLDACTGGHLEAIQKYWQKYWQKRVEALPHCYHGTRFKHITESLRAA